jgi:hypothetical protein
MSNYILKSTELRGRIIEQAITLERYMDYYIASHFCKDNNLRREFMSLIVSTDRITFESKRQVLKVLIETYNKDFSAANPKIFSDLIKIMENRNQLAHYMINPSEESQKKFTNNGTITFKKFKNDLQDVEYSKQHVEELSNLISHYTDKLKKIIEL